MIDCNCELCGAPAATSIRGISVCSECVDSLVVGTKRQPRRAQPPSEPPHWKYEIPSGLSGYGE